MHISKRKLVAAGILALIGILLKAGDLIGVGQMIGEAWQWIIWLGPWALWIPALLIFAVAEGPIIKENITGNARRRRILGELLLECRAFTKDRPTYDTFPAWRDRWQAWFDEKRKFIQDEFGPADAGSFYHLRYKVNDVYGCIHEEHSLETQKILAACDNLKAMIGPHGKH